uniref:Uncharacterized protein n=1 Tax=Oryza nivara TaxID=4536 RepID=A0A0E0J9D9_ORYNI
MKFLLSLLSKRCSSVLTLLFNREKMPFNASAAATAPPAKHLVGVRLNAMASSDGSSRSGDLFPSFTDPMVSPLPLARIRRRLRREGLDPATSSSPARIPSSLSAPLTLIRGRRRREGPDPVVSTVVAASLPPPLLHARPIHRTLPSPSSPCGDGGGKVGLLALDVALAFPQATTSQFPPAGETSSLAFPVEKMFASYLAM